jgi:hypothetical protein
MIVRTRSKILEFWRPIMPLEYSFNNRPTIGLLETPSLGVIFMLDGLPLTLSVYLKAHQELKAGKMTD